MPHEAGPITQSALLPYLPCLLPLPPIRSIRLYVCLSSRENITRTRSCAYTRTHSHIRQHLQICTHRRCVRHKRAGRYRGVSLHYRTRGSSRSEREKVMVKAENRSPVPTPSALRRRINATIPRTTRFPVLHTDDPPAAHHSTSRGHPGHQDRGIRARCEKELEEAEFTCHVHIHTANLHSDSVNPIYIADRPSGNNRRDNRASSQIPTRPQSIVAHRKKRRKNDRASYVT